MAEGSEIVEFVSLHGDFYTTNAIRVFLKAKPMFEVLIKAEEDGDGGVHALGMKSY